MSQSHSTEETIFEAARQIGDADKQAAYLDLACGKDEALRQRIEQLLRAGSRAKDFFQKHGATLRVPQSDPVAPISEGAGSIIGRYKLLQQIGEGGCGLVYMAEQEEPVRRRVALKVVKLGMDTKQVIARFEAERQALALMDHANIAKVLDAGATDSGRPYFVMELVRGIKITDYCDEHNLSTKERLDLFIQVCHAVQHAHQKGIIHRDLKPSNILVASDDGVPVPKVIDFGIAKATQGRLTDQTLFTAFEQFIGTPAYMSPEQAELTMQDVDTRTDIYSLGVLLYELLTGKTPLDQNELLSAGLEEMRRTIREKEPARPSTRLSTMLEGELTTTAKHRQTDAPKLVHLLRGDLDWIVMKALEKERVRRYETANSLANDVQRHLNCEPVVARPPSRLYEFQKTVRRHRFGFAAAAALMTVLAVGVVVSTSEAIRATRAEREQRLLRQAAQQAQANEAGQRLQAEQARLQAEANEKKAETAAAKSQQVADFLKKMLQGVGPSRALGRDTAMLRDILDETARSVRQDLTNQPEVEAELLAMLGTVYVELRELTSAAAMNREALAIRRKLHANGHPEVATSLVDVAYVLWNQGNLAEAESLLREALAIRKRLLGEEDPEVATVLHQLGQVLMFESRLAESEGAQRQALAIRRKAFGNDHVVVAVSLRDLGYLLASQDRLIEAEAMTLDALAIGRKLFGDPHPEVAWDLDDLGYVLERQDKLKEAEGIYREAVAMQRKLKEDPHLGHSLNQLGLVLWRQHRLPEAEAAFREALSVSEKLVGNEPHLVATWAANLARVLREQGKLAEADALERQAADLGDVLTQNNIAWHWATDPLPNLRNASNAVVYAEKVVSATSRTNSMFLDTLAAAYAEAGQFTNAVRVQQEAVSFLQTEAEKMDYGYRLKLYQSNQPYRDHGQLAEMIRALLEAGKYAEAEPLARQCLAIREQEIPDDWRASNARSMLGGALLGQKNYAEAESLLLSGYEGMKQREDKIPAEGKPRLKEALQRLVQLYQSTDRLDQAARWKQKLAESDKAGKL